MLQPSSIAYSNTLLCVLMQLVCNTLVNVLLEYVTRSMFFIVRTGSARREGHHGGAGLVRQRRSSGWPEFGRQGDDGDLIGFCYLSSDAQGRADLGAATNQGMHAGVEARLQGRRGAGGDARRVGAQGPW